MSEEKPKRGDEFSVAPPPSEPVLSRRLISVVVALALVLAAGGYFALRLTRSAEAQVYRYDFRQGETFGYEITMNMKGTPKGLPEVSESFEGRMTASMDFTVVEVREDGSAVIEMAMRNIQVTPADVAVSTDPGTVRVTIGPDGRVTDVEGLQGLFSSTGVDPTTFFGLPGGAADSVNSQFFFPQYPSEAIAPGAKWSESSSFPIPFGDEEVTVKVDGSHDGFEDTEYGRAARIHHKVTAPMDFEFSIAELFASITQFAQEFGESAPSEPPPAALRDAKMVFNGSMVMDSDALVLPDNGHFVQMDGRGTMSFQMRFEGVPAGQFGGQPTEFAMDATFDMSVVRVR